MKLTLNNSKDIYTKLTEFILQILQNKYFFLLIVLLNLYPVVTNTFFATLDGAAHLYNAKLINDLLFTKDSLSHSFFQFTPYIVPNYLGHFILSFFLLFLPAYAAEKAFLILYLITLPYAFRYLSGCLNTNKSFSYFVFPFTYSFFVFLGFYNFIIGFSIFFFGLGFFYKHYGRRRFINYFSLFLISLCLYLSHPLLLFIWLLCLFIVFLNFTFKSYLIDKTISINRILKLAIYTFISLLPVLILGLKYYLMQAPTQGIRVSFLELIKWILKTRTLMSLVIEYEHTYTILLFCIFIILGISFIFNFINKKTRNEAYLSFKKSIFIASICILLLLFYFILPDQMAQGAYVSSRFNLLFFFFFIIFFSFFKTKKWILISTIFFMFFIHFTLLNYHNKVMTPLNECAEEMFECNKRIKENSTVMCVNKTGNWLQEHTSNYAGLKKGIILSDNYEAHLGYFPLTWRNSFSTTFNKDSIIKTDYILIYGNYPLLQNKFETNINTAIHTNYTLDYTSSKSFVKLYKLKTIIK